MTNLFKTPKTPVVPPPAEMPTPDDAASRAAKRKSIEAMNARTGRSSTILTDFGSAKDTLGG